MNKIYIYWNSPSAVHRLGKAVSELPKSGQQIFTIVVPNHVRTYPK